MRCEWEPAGAFQWSLIKKEALGYLQAAGEEITRMKVRQVPDSLPMDHSSFSPEFSHAICFLLNSEASFPLCSQPDNGYSSVSFTGTEPEGSDLGSGVFACKLNTHCTFAIHVQFIYTILCLSTHPFSMQMQISKSASGIQLKARNNLEVHYFSPTIRAFSLKGCLNVKICGVSLRFSVGFQTAEFSG